MAPACHGPTPQTACWPQLDLSLASRSPPHMHQILAAWQRSLLGFLPRGLGHAAAVCSDRHVTLCLSRMQHVADAHIM